MADYWDDVIAGAFNILGASMQADAARDAANTASDSYVQGIQEMRLATNEARAMILDRMNPALRDFNNQIVGMQNEVAAGSVDIMNIMNRTTAGVDTLLAGTGANVQRALMGSTATSRGIPNTQFNSTFNRVLSMPPEQQTQALRQFESAVNTYQPTTQPGAQPATGFGPIEAPVTGGIAAGVPGMVPGGMPAEGSGLPRADGGGGFTPAAPGVQVGGEGLSGDAASRLGQAAGGFFGGLLGTALAPGLGTIAGATAGRTAGGQLGELATTGAGGIASGEADVAGLAAAEARSQQAQSMAAAEGAMEGAHGDANYYNPTTGEYQSTPFNWASVGVGQQAAPAGVAAGAAGVAALTPEQQAQLLQLVQRGEISQEDAARIGYDVSATTPRVGSAVGGGAIPMVQDSSGQYVAPSTMPTGFAGAFGELGAGEQTALQRLAMGTGAARQDIAGGVTSALAEYAPYSTAGAGAVQQEAALSGALGPEAQQAAMDAFIESPGQRYLREQQEKALLRSGAAIGGLGGGAMKSALMEQAMGIASTQQQQHLENLRSLASRGQTAAGARAGITQTGSQQLAALAQQLGVAGADLATMTSQQKAALAERAGMSLAQLEQQIGQARIANLEGYGQGLAQLRGQELAATTGLGQLAATTTLGAQQDISSQLANLATLQGSTSAGMTAAAGQAQAAGQMAQGQIWGNTASSLGNLAAYGNQPTTQPITIQLQQ